MQKFIILSTVFMCFISCSVKEKPEFVRVQNIKIIDANSNYVNLSADALFKNPNTISGNLLTDGIKVFVNDIKMATIISEEFKVPAKKEFTIPLKVNIPSDSIFNNQGIAGLIGSLLSKKVKVQYKGDIKYKVLGFSHKYHIDKTEDIKIKL